MLVVALTGNYGMGKSLAASLFRSCGAYTLDSDALVADQLQKEAVIKKIRKLLGPGILNADKRLDKKAVADIIFHDKKRRKEIEALLHPLVFRAVKASIQRLRSDEAVIIVEVPLLFEGGFQNRFDRTIAVYTSQKTALARLKKAGVSRSDALARLHSQMEIRQKQRLADYVINNNGTRQQLMAQVRKIFESLRSDFSGDCACGLKRFLLHRRDA